MGTILWVLFIAYLFQNFFNFADWACYLNLFSGLVLNQYLSFTAFYNFFQHAGQRGEKSVFAQHSCECAASSCCSKDNSKPGNWITSSYFIARFQFSFT